MSTTDLHDHLNDLHHERALAQEAGLALQPAYMADLDQEIALTQAAYIGAAVTEIATLRGLLSGRPQG